MLRRHKLLWRRRLLRLLASVEGLLLWLHRLAGLLHVVKGLVRPRLEWVRGLLPLMELLPRLLLMARRQLLRLWHLRQMLLLLRVLWPLQLPRLLLMGLLTLRPMGLLHRLLPPHCLLRWRLLHGMRRRVLQRAVVQRPMLRH